PRTSSDNGISAGNRRPDVVWSRTYACRAVISPGKFWNGVCLRSQYAEAISTKATNAAIPTPPKIKIRRVLILRPTIDYTNGRSLILIARFLIQVPHIIDLIANGLLMSTSKESGLTARFS